jgi:GYF domain 2
VGKRGLHCSRNASAYVADGIVDSPVRSMNYIIQKPDVSFETYSLEGLRVAVASGEVQLDWQARNNGKEITVREALSTCYECGKEINSLDVACPSCGAPFRAAQPSLESTTDFHVAREGKHFGPYTEVAARDYLADGRINADDLCWRPGMDTWLPASLVLQLAPSGRRTSNRSDAVAGFLGFFFGPVGLWYKGHWAAGFAWLAMIVIVALAKGGVGIVFAPIFWIGMTIHAIVAKRPA